MLVEAPDGGWVVWDGPGWRERADFSPSVADPWEVIAPYVARDPDWVVLGGLGNVDEISPALRRWPSARVLGVDPDDRAVAWQLANVAAWSDKNQIIVHAALSDQNGTAFLAVSDLCHASIHLEHLRRASLRKEEVAVVRTDTLDHLSDEHGPFRKAVLSLDLEDFDYWALLGARGLLAAGAFQAINVEVRYEQAAAWAEMRGLLAGHGYSRRLVWFRQWWGHNEIYTRDWVYRWGPP